MKKIALKNTVKVGANAHHLSTHQMADGWMMTTVKNDTAAGAGLSRVLSKMGSKVDFCIFSCFRNERTFSQNEMEFKKIPAYLRIDLGDPKFGGYWLVGHWKECKGLEEGVTVERAGDCEKLGGELIDSMEYSWLFVRPDHIDADTFFDTCFAWVREFKQETWITRRDGRCTVRSGKTDEVWDTLQADAHVLEDFLGKVGYLNANYSQWGYSELRKNTKPGGKSTPMVFMPKEGKCLVAAPRVGVRIPNSSGYAGLAFKKEGIRYDNAQPI